MLSHTKEGKGRGNPLSDVLDTGIRKKRGSISFPCTGRKRSYPHLWGKKGGGGKMMQNSYVRRVDSKRKKKGLNTWDENWKKISRLPIRKLHRGKRGEKGWLGPSAMGREGVQPYVFLGDSTIMRHHTQKKREKTTAHRLDKGWNTRWDKRGGGKSFEALGENSLIDHIRRGGKRKKTEVLIPLVTTDARRRKRMYLLTYLPSQGVLSSLLAHGKREEKNHLYQQTQRWENKNERGKMHKIAIDEAQ